MSKRERQSFTTLSLRREEREEKEGEGELRNSIKRERVSREREDSCGSSG